MRDQRSVKRTHMLKHAKILAADSATPIDCIVYDLTNSGAGLRISPEDSVPDRFELIFESILFRRNCQVRWRHNERLGVEFSDKVRQLPALKIETTSVSRAH